MLRRVLILLLVLLPLPLAAAAKFPPLTGRVVDNAGIIDAATQQRLTSQLAAYEQQSGNQIVVVTLPSLQGLPIEDYGYQLGRFWGIGQKDKNTGALLIVAPNERQTRIEVGYGLEGELTDARSKIIIEQVMLPRFRQGDYATGISDGVSAMLQVLGGNGAALAPATMQGEQDASGWPVFLLLLFFFLLFRSFGRRRSGLLDAMVIGSMMRGGGGGFSGGGDYFRGGGGSFGGGGASGRW